MFAYPLTISWDARFVGPHLGDGNHPPSQRSEQNRPACGVHIYLLVI